MLYLPSENAPAPPNPFIIAHVGHLIQALTFLPSIGHFLFSNVLPSSNTATLVSGDFFISSYAEKIPPGPAPIIITSYSIHYPPRRNFLGYYIIESGLCGIV